MASNRQLPRTWLNRVRGWFSASDWVGVRCFDCKAERLVRVDPGLDATPAPVQSCGACGSDSIYPLDQGTAMFCPGCDHDLVHQPRTVEGEHRPDAIQRHRCGYCGTVSTWHMATPAPIRVKSDKLDYDLSPSGGDA